MNESVSEIFLMMSSWERTLLLSSFHSFWGRAVQAGSPKGSLLILSHSALRGCVCMAYCDAAEWIMSTLNTRPKHIQPLVYLWCICASLGDDNPCNQNICFGWEDIDTAKFVWKHKLLKLNKPLQNMQKNMKNTWSNSWKQDCFSPLCFKCIWFNTKYVFSP